MFIANGERCKMVWWKLSKNSVYRLCQEISSSKPDCPVHFINFANYASVRAMEVDVSEEITCKRQNQSQFLSLSH